MKLALPLLLPLAAVLADKACFQENLSGLALHALECVDVTATLHAELNTNDERRSRTRICDDTELFGEWEACNEVVTQFMASQEAQQQLHDVHNSTCTSAEDVNIVASTMCQYRTTDGYAAALEEGLCMQDAVNGGYCLDNYFFYIDNPDTNPVTGWLRFRESFCRTCVTEGYISDSVLFFADYAFQACVVEANGVRPNTTNEIGDGAAASILSVQSAILATCAPSVEDDSQNCGSVLIDTIDATYESVQQQE
ncbi:MAG: hypothetical protein MHM6MM_008447 [Cercozoa sp. M6MM]